MKKYYGLILGILLYGETYAQVGINTEQPKTTLHIMKGDANSIDGVLIPKLTGNELKAKNHLYNADQKGVLVYVTEAFTTGANETITSSNKIIHVKSPGFYYFNGSHWISLEGENWKLNGNNVSDNSFIGTLNNKDLNFKRNNVFAGRISSSNVVFGTDALNNVEGNELNENTNNVAIGSTTLKNNTTGFSNIAIGSSVLSKNTTGRQNTAIGVNALQSSTTGYNNVALGQAALKSITSGDGNVAIGYGTLGSTNIAGYNTIIGSNSGYKIVNGNNNIILGANLSLHNSTTAKTVNNSMNIGNIIYARDLSVGLNGTYGLNNAKIGIGQENPLAKLHITPNTNQKALIIEGITENTNPNTNYLVINSNGEVQKTSTPLTETKLVKNVQTDYTLLNNDYLINVSGNTSLTITLPNADLFANKVVYIRNNNTNNSSVSFNISINGFSENQIANNKTLQIISDGTTWYMVSYN